MFSDVNLNDDVRNTSAQNTRDRFLFTFGRIRISIQGYNPGFPYLVCKNIYFRAFPRKQDVIFQEFREIANSFFFWKKKKKKNK